MHCIVLDPDGAFVFHCYYLGLLWVDFKPKLLADVTKILPYQLTQLSNAISRAWLISIAQYKFRSYTMYDVNMGCEIAQACLHICLVAISKVICFWSPLQVLSFIKFLSSSMESVGDIFI